MQLTGSHHRKLELTVFLLFYLFFAMVYYWALRINTDFEWNPWDNVTIDYALKFLLSIPVYWLVFKRLHHWPTSRRLALHLVLGPLWIGFWILLYYGLTDLLDIGHLIGTARIWDIYIPFLFYILQFGILHGYDYLQQLWEKERQEEALKRLALTQEIKALKAQIQPHFLFNTLNSISASVPPSMEHTRELIAQLADTFRFGLQASLSEWVPVRDELHFLDCYLGLEQHRFQDRLEYHIHADEAVLDMSIPPMLLQPLVENAIKHGLGNSMEKTGIEVAIRLSGKELAFEVKDSGPGMTAGVDWKEAEGTGLRNTRLRLEKGFGSSLHFKPNLPRGAVFYFSLPIEKLSLVRQERNSAPVIIAR